jgi:hypothetical protein
MSEAGNRRFVLRARPEVIRAQSRKYAQVALEHYNQKVWCTYAFYDFIHLLFFRSIFDREKKN